MIEISVIMPAYNAELYIESAIESLLSQTYTDFELIIINDASKDGTEEIIKRYQEKDSRIIYIKNEKNLNSVKSRNIGIEMAKGKYIAMMDADDLAHKDRLRLQYNFLESNPDISLVGANYTLMDYNGKDIPYDKDFCLKKEEIKEALEKNNIFAHSALFFRNIGFRYRDKFYYADDYDFLLRIISDGKLLYNLKERLINYRISPNSITGSSEVFKTWLYIAKARDFYYERLSSGKDSYEKFDYKSFSKIEDFNTHTDKIDLLRAIKYLIILKDFNKIGLLIKKYKSLYSDKRFVLFAINILNSNKITRIFLNKLISRHF